MYPYKRLKSFNKDEHRIIAGVENLGFNIIVHHIDGNKKNNSIENLEIMTRSEHAKAHKSYLNLKCGSNKIKITNGKKKCTKCNKTKNINLFQINKQRYSGHDSVCKKCRSEIYKYKKLQTTGSVGDILE